MPGGETGSFENEDRKVTAQLCISPINVYIVASTQGKSNGRFIGLYRKIANGHLGAISFNPFF